MTINPKIATILPYKENYTFGKAQAAAIWVCDFFKYSRFRESNFIFGNTNGSDYLTKNYINIKINNLKSKFSSSTHEYCKNFIKKTKNLHFDIIEIHNRPLVFNYLKKDINTKYIMYFHNDPLSMNGSKSVNERIELLGKCAKIIFNSEWSKKRFLTTLKGIYIKSQKLIVIHQSAEVQTVNINNIAIDANKLSTLSPPIDHELRAASIIVAKSSLSSSLADKAYGISKTLRTCMTR